MLDKNKKALRDASPYNAVLTREQFLFYEMRTTARLIAEGLEDSEIIERVVQENLFQYPTEKMVKRMVVARIVPDYLQFKEGITWSYITSGSLSFRKLWSNELF